MKRILFCAGDLSVMEDQDYPGDPAPYLTFTTADGRSFAIELEASADLARAITAWIIEIRARELRITQEAERAAALERERRRRERVQLESGGYQRESPTLLEVIQQSKRRQRRAG